mgnify:CR=1 FL=1
MKKILIILAILAAAASGPRAAFDKTVHDFGKVTLKDGALSCTFTVTNEGDDDLLIESVVSSCGCTDVKWTRTAIGPGESGTIEATYSNDEGPYPFDKTLTVYTSDKERPSVLHIRGTVRKK